MEKTTFQWILNKLPYSKPFLFVDDISHVDSTGAEGTCVFNANAEFYKGHFVDNPVTPGVLLTECCAQIGLVCLGIYFLGEESKLEDLKIGMSSSEMEFLLPVFPGEQVRVVSELVYFRFQKLKCTVRMYNKEDKLVCKGTLAGMMGKSNG
ncbi:3-hydroxyacyl-ACP dehydratase FabZ family protein [Maribacter hydrothermalis]|uniref:Hydroxymyristoyl-ACP dehydratase n=1 Tax=Maribacter hydrothermalis TaxID=1836467 RepID=A0A1B7Z879_9FLAO|nr:hydroxymyristoyl-ACP dehydratase [Maribacter hydrothermalis]APQ19074.1 hydroxymyristoyl-ACP dehydratase [Maribacter hydrothermalis]OBR38914.1 hydroxymyristoyl-ACP dehydratase [Maribacter hydrothermalis]